MSSPERLYRPNAWNAYRRGTELGEPLELSFGWGHAVHHALVLALLVTVALLVCVPIRDDVRGKAFVRFAGARAVGAASEGPVERVLVKAGERVKAGQPVVELHHAEASAQVERLTREHDGLWLRLLRDPLDLDARQAMTTTLPDLRRARALLAELTVRAPADGVVSDVRVVEGRHVAKGDTLFVVVPEGARAEVVAVLPAAARPQLGTSSAARFWVDGADTNTGVQLTEVRGEAVGPTEIARVLGPTVQGSVAATGMSIVVTGALAEQAFPSDGRLRPFYPGMSGELDVALDRKPLLFLLVPSLRRWVYR